MSCPASSSHEKLLKHSNQSCYWLQFLLDFSGHDSDLQWPLEDKDFHQWTWAGQGWFSTSLGSISWSSLGFSLIFFFFFFLVCLYTQSQYPVLSLGIFFLGVKSVINFSLDEVLWIPPQKSICISEDKCPGENSWNITNSYNFFSSYCGWGLIRRI